MSSFRRVAPHYETLMAEVPYAMWVEYLKMLWAKVGIQPRSVLEVCCGTGRICRMLAAEGYEVAGVDLSPEMIAEAKHIASESHLPIEFSVQDASEMRLNRRFDAALSFFDSLNNIIDYDRFAAAIQRTYEHLKPGGAFIFDLNTAYAFEHNMFDLFCKDKRAKVRYEWKGEWDAARSLCTIKMEFATDRERFSELHVQRAYSLAEVKQAMASAGFENVEIFHAYTMNPPRASSDRIHVLGLRG